MNKKKMLWLMTIVTTVMFCIAFTSCDHDDDELNIDEDNKENTGNNDEEDTRYYVKYEVYIGYAHGWGSHEMRISYTTENGTQNVKTTSATWEGTYGPIKKGTKLRISAYGNLARNDTYNYVRLSVCRNKEPFVIKAEERKLGASSLSVGYEIE